MTTGALDQIPRSSLLLVLVAQLAVIGPHVPRLSPWILGMWAICVLWRLFIFQGRWGYPGTLVKGALILLAAVGVGTSYGALYGLDPAAALLIIAFALKLLEMRDRRDALIVIYLAWFVIGVEFLYVQSMAMAAYELLATLIVTAALVGLHQSFSRPRLGASVRTASVLMLQAVPLAVVMFLFFPRIAPLWSVPLPDASARTGLSDSMSPGQIAELGRSEELAFRVEFEGEPPPQSELYWRALTFSRYEDGTWSGGPLPTMGEALVYWTGMRREPDWLQQSAPAQDAPALRYSVLVEPTYRPWLFGLDQARTSTPGTGIGRDYRIMAAEPVASRMRYDVRSYPRASLDPELPGWMRRRETALPADGNPRTRSLVAELQGRTGTDGAFVGALLEQFRTQPFYYTLTPPTLDADAIDGFLFDTRRGFCAHYAGAFVYMARLAGIPARVVAGYQGGESNPRGTHLIVRQYDAHAWAEIWLPGSDSGGGWVRIDPTAAVAPERIERGAQAAFAADEAGEGFSPFAGDGWRSIAWVMDAVFFLDTIEHRWNLLVLSYDSTRQNAFLEDLLGEVTPTRVAIAVTAAGTLAVGLSGLGWLVMVLRTRRAPVLRLHDALVATFTAAGLPRAPKESPRAYQRRLARRFPHLAADIEQVVSPLDAALFDPDADAGQSLRTPTRALRRLRLQLVLDRLRRTFRRPPRPAHGVGDGR